MTANQLDAYTQGLLDRVIAMTKEIDNLRAAYIAVDNRLNKLTFVTEKNAKELINEASKVEGFAKLALDATKLTEQSSKLTKNIQLIEAAKISRMAAESIYQLAVEIRTLKLPKLEQGLRD